MFSRFTLFILTYLCLSTYALTDIINNIEITGNKRLSNETIVLFSKLEINKDYNEEDLNISLRNLNDTNFFKKISLKLENNTLLIDVIENPIIEDLKIIGVKNKGFTEKLYSFMILKSRKSFTETTFLKDLSVIQNILKKNGYYFSNVKTSKTTNEEQNSIRLIYDIDLGDKAEIKEISFIGDKKFKDRKLKNTIVSEEAMFYKFLSNKIYLDEKRIELDKRLLLSYYKNRGYYLAKINNSFIESQENKSFKLIFNINAGEKYTFNDLKLNLPVDFDEVHFVSIRKLLDKLIGKPYSLDNINKILNEVDKIALSKQYEFVRASLSESIVDNNKLDFIVSLSESEKSYVERINITGNHITLEEVIRNSFIVDEGDPYNEILFNNSVNKIKSKNIFAKVETKIKEGTSKSLKIININVEEKPTGEISLGAGVGTNGGTLGGGIKENNFLGKGIKLDTNLSISDETVKGKFSYVRPNFNYSDNELSTSIESTTTDKLDDSGYKASNLGLSLGTSFQQYDNLYFSPKITASFEDLVTTSSANTHIKKQEGEYFDINLPYYLTYNDTNRGYQPSEGYSTTFYQNIPLISETYEIINGFEFNKYQTLISDMVARLSFYGRAANSITGDDVRLSKRLYLPSNKLRGFESGKVGPVGGGNFIGGNYVSSINFSTTLPQILPSFQNTDFNMFVDAGNVWGVDHNNANDASSKIRSSFGVAMDVLTPVGPMSFSLAQPITKKTSDKTESFRFNLGTTF